jgi:transposase InsO family protein
MRLPQGPDQRWSLDFVSDVLADGRRFRTLVVVDDFVHECLALVVDASISGRRFRNDRLAGINYQNLRSERVLHRQRIPGGGNCP